MNNLGKLAVIMASFAALAACARTSPPDTAADQAAIRAVGTSWYKAYNSGDGAAVAALYAEDAVLSAPHVPAARGAASIREYFLKDAATFTAQRRDAKWMIIRDTWNSDVASPSPEIAASTSAPRTQ